MFISAITAGIAYLCFPLARSWGAFVVLTAIGANSLMYVSAAGGALVGRMVTSRAQGGAAYAGYRVWGSVGYIVVSLLTGLLLGGRPATEALGRENLV